MHWFRFSKVCNSAMKVQWIKWVYDVDLYSATRWGWEDTNHWGTARFSVFITTHVSTWQINPISFVALLLNQSSIPSKPLSTSRGIGGAIFCGLWTTILAENTHNLPFLRWSSCGVALSDLNPTRLSFSLVVIHEGLLSISWPPVGFCISVDSATVVTLNPRMLVLAAD